MKMKYAPNSGGNFKIPPAGSYNARIVSIIDLGTQMESGFNGAPPTQKKRIRWTVELVDTNEVFIPEKGQQPHHVSLKKFTKSLGGNTNNMRKLIETFLGREIAPGEDVNLASFLNSPCTVQVIHKADKQDASKIYANVNNVSLSMNPMSVAPLRNPPIFFDMDQPSCIQAYQLINSKSILEKIHASPEFKSLVARGLIQQRVIEQRQQAIPAQQGYNPIPTIPQQQQQQQPQQAPQGAWTPPPQSWQQPPQQVPQQVPQQAQWGNVPPKQPQGQPQQNQQWGNQQPQQSPPPTQQQTTWGTPQPGQPINQPPYNHPLNPAQPQTGAIPPAPNWGVDPNEPPF